MKYLKSFEEVNESRLTRGLATAALVGALGCTTPGCKKIKDDAYTFRVEKPEYDKGLLRPGDYISIEIPERSGIKDYHFIIKSDKDSILNDKMSGVLNGTQGLKQEWKIPSDYTGNLIKV
jgi:hypothetical protein